MDGTQSIATYAGRDFTRYETYYDRKNELLWKVSLLDDIMDHCRNADVPLIFVYPPNYKVHDPNFVSRIKELTGGEALHFVYDYQDSTWDNKDLYYDTDHLHVSGARKFTNELIGFLRRL